MKFPPLTACSSLHPPFILLTSQSLRFKKQCQNKLILQQHAELSMKFPPLITSSSLLPPPSILLTTQSLRFKKPSQNKLPTKSSKSYLHCFRNSSLKKTAALPNPRNENSTSHISRATLIWRAIKLPFYSVAFIPLTVGYSASYLQSGLFFPNLYFPLLLSSFLVITWLNISNDVYDSETGVDQDKKESIVNIFGSRNVIQIVAYALLALGFFGLLWAFKEAGDVRFILLVTCAILCGYVYQCPPFRLSYKGLGEPLCFAAFGPFATTAFYFSNNSKNLPNLPLTPTVMAASFLVGVTTTLILFCSHFHQIDGDLDGGKLSPLVRLGTETASKLVKFGVASLYLLLFSFTLFKLLPLSCAVICAFTLPLGKLVVDFVQENHHDKSKIFMAKYYCLRLHASFGLALAIGLALARNRSNISLQLPILS